MRYVRIAAPSVEVVTLPAAKAHLRVDHSADDSLITALIGAAVQYFDGRSGILGRALGTQTWRLETAAPAGGCLSLELPPVSAVDKVEYLRDGAMVEWPDSEWRLGYKGEIAFVVPLENRVWPSTDARENAWSVSFTAGAAAADVPEPLRVALLMLIGHFYQNREAVSAGGMAELPLAVSALIAPYRRIAF